MSQRQKSLFYAGTHSTKGLGSTAGADVESVIGDEEFPVDDELVNTAAYRRAMKASQRIISGQVQVESPTTSTPPTSPSSAKRSSTAGLSKFFRNAMKIDDSGGPSTSISKTATSTSITAVTTPTVVEPIDETILRDDGVVTEEDVRDTRAKFHELMAVHREILAMKFADESYKNVLEEKINKRKDGLKELQLVVSNWLDKIGHTPEELSDLMRMRYSLKQLAHTISVGGGFIPLDRNYLTPEYLRAMQSLPDE